MTQSQLALECIRYGALIALVAACFFLFRSGYVGARLAAMSSGADDYGRIFEKHRRDQSRFICTVLFIGLPCILFLMSQSKGYPQESWVPLAQFLHRAAIIAIVPIALLAFTVFNGKRNPFVHRKITRVLLILLAVAAVCGTPLLLSMRL